MFETTIFFVLFTILDFSEMFVFMIATNYPDAITPATGMHVYIYVWVCVCVCVCVRDCECVCSCVHVCV